MSAIYASLFFPSVTLASLSWESLSITAEEHKHNSTVIEVKCVSVQTWHNLGCIPIKGCVICFVGNSMQMWQLTTHMAFPHKVEQGVSGAFLGAAVFA